MVGVPYSKIIALLLRFGLPGLDVMSALALLFFALHMWTDKDKRGEDILKKLEREDRREVALKLVISRTHAAWALLFAGVIMMPISIALACVLFQKSGR